MARPAPTRYLTLDAMRGAAALAVALFHFDRALVPHGYLAVDLFFALSGFVLGHAYDQRFRDGLTAGRFVELRLVRLWPLLAAGIVLGTAYAALMRASGVAAFLSWGALTRAALLNLAVLPDPLFPALYPCNAVFWSIATELFVNLLYAARLTRLRTITLAALALVAAVALALLAGPPLYADSGPLWDGLPLGTVRTLASFVIGLVLARIAVPRGRRTGAVALVPVAAVVGILVLAAPDVGGRLYDLAAILVAFPALIALAVAVEPPRMLAAASALLGDLSYPIYAVHVPIASGALILAAHEGVAPPAAAVPYLAIVVVIGWAAAYWWDVPVRRALSRRLTLRRSAMPIVV